MRLCRAAWQGKKGGKKRLVMERLRRLADGIDFLNEQVGRGASWLSVVLVGVVFGDVVMRYLFNRSFVAVQELEWHLFSMLFLLAAGYTLRHDQHVRVDLFYQQWGARTRAWINLVGVLLFLLPGCYLLLTVSIPWVMTAYEIGEISPDPGGIPARYLIKSMLPLGFFLVSLQGFSLAITSLLTLLEPHVD